MTLRVWLLGMAMLGATAAQADCRGHGDIEKDLACLPGVGVREVFSAEDPKIPAGYRRFELSIEQPVDHFNAAYGKFTQRLALLHKDAQEPMILQTSGYQIFSVALSELARVFGANQIQVEHRFFDQSIPNVIHWGKLDIVQSAYDFHRITQVFKTLYGGRWVNTGASKGGMTSAFHHMFFPSDLNGTVADVAPLSFSREDKRYVAFVDQAGGTLYRDCRRQLTDLQIALLKRRDEVLPLITGSFVFLRGKGVAYEHAVIELPFVFWQYKDPKDPKIGCDHIPGVAARAADLAEFLKEVNPVADYGDTSILSFLPYYFQAASQLGSPAAALRHLDGYRRYPYTIDQYSPPNLSYTYSNRAMIEVDNWARTKADHIMFVYGEFDPWSAAAYPRVSKAADFHWFQVPGGNHSSKLFKLPKPEREKALAVVGVWLNKAAILTPSRSDEISLDEAELDYRRTRHIP